MTYLCKITYSWKTVDGWEHKEDTFRLHRIPVSGDILPLSPSSEDKSAYYKVTEVVLLPIRRVKHGGDVAGNAKQPLDDLAAQVYTAGYSGNPAPR